MWKMPITLDLHSLAFLVKQTHIDTLITMQPTYLGMFQHFTQLAKLGSHHTRHSGLY
jgi:hypothetical protein